MSRDLTGYNGYQVSDQGRVKDPHCKITIGRLTTQGYYLTTVGKWRNVRVNVLVATIWLENPDNLPMVAHKNEKKSDNRACNLEWSTHSENSKSAHENGALRKCKKLVEITNLDSGETFQYSSLKEADEQTILEKKTIAKYAKIGKVYHNKSDGNSYRIKYLN